MAFDFELYFTGICLFDMDSFGKPPSCRALLLNTTNNPHKDWLPPVDLTKHAPRLVVNARNLKSAGTKDWKPDGMFVTAEGEDCLVFHLEGRDLELECATRSPLKLNDTSPRWPAPVKEYKSENRSFYYTLKVPELDTRIKTLGSTNPGSNNTVITRLEFNKGHLSCFELGRRRGEFMLFEFKTAGGAPAQWLDRNLHIPRAISDRLVLRIARNEDAIFIRDKGDPERVIAVGPLDQNADPPERVRVSFTNLDADHHPAREAIFDFLWYYTLFDWKSGSRPPGSELAIPWPKGFREAGRTPSSGTCPPGSG